MTYSSVSLWKSCGQEWVKGQEISEWIYEVVALPKIWTKKIKKFCPDTTGQNFSNCFVHILGSATTLYIHSEISWPLQVASFPLQWFIFCYKFRILMRLSVGFLGHLNGSMTSINFCERTQLYFLFGLLHGNCWCLK